MKYVALLVAALSVSGCFGTKSLGEGTDDTTISSPAIKQELLNRWNASVHEYSRPIDFTWRKFEQFPHPTYIEGTDEAYRVFAQVLLAFLEAGDNFDYLTEHDLFDASVYYQFENGETDFWTFRVLVRQLASEGAFGIDAATQEGLSQMAYRMDQEG